MSKNEDVLRGVTDDAKVRPSILDPRTKRWRIFSLEEAWVDRTPVGKIIDDTIFENSMLTKFRSRYVSGFVALSHLMPQIEVDHSRPASPQVKVIEDLFLGDITRSIADHNDKMPSHLRLRIPYAVPHIGYEADGVPRRQTEACAAVFLSVILGEGAIAGSEIRHALRPIDVSPEGSDQLEHDLLNHFLGRGTVGREPSEIYLSLDDTRRARELSFIPVDHDGSIQCGTKPGLLDFSAEWVDLSRYNLTNSRTAAEHRRRARSTRAITRWAYTL